MRILFMNREEDIDLAMETAIGMAYEDYED